MLKGVTSGPVPALEYQRINVRDANYLVGSIGSGPPVLLLHGFPQTHYCWRGVVPTLAEKRTVVVADLRGYGATTAPAGGPQGQGYSKREMATELMAVMDALDIQRFTVAGHDRGARVAYRMALDHPNRVDKLIVLNVIPTIDQFEGMGDRPSLGYWPWFLLAQPAPFPERLIRSNSGQFLRFIFESWTRDPAAIDAEAFDEYLRALRESSIASMCADYRASFWLDQHDDAADRKAGRRIECPVLLITGADETQLADAPSVWESWTHDLHSSTLPCGHFIPEEAPQPLARSLLDFLTGC